jgi:hypothetical protein
LSRGKYWVGAADGLEKDGNTEVGYECEELEKEAAAIRK